jgi:hypothetical protein
MAFLSGSSITTVDPRPGTSLRGRSTVPPRAIARVSAVSMSATRMYTIVPLALTV